MTAIILWMSAAALTGWSIRKRYLLAIPTFMGSITGLILQAVGISFSSVLLIVMLIIFCLDITVVFMRRKDIAFQDYWTLIE